MPRAVPSRPVILTFLGVCLGLAPSGCSLTSGDVSPAELTPPKAIYQHSSASSFIKVTTVPPGAEVWIGPGCQAADSAASDSASSNPRYLGHTPLSARITVADLLPGGDLAYSIRYESSRQEGQIARARHAIRQGGSLRIEAEFTTALPPANQRQSGPVAGR